MVMRVDGGMSKNNWMMQFLADILDMKIERPINQETTIMGAAFIAGIKAEIFVDLEHIGDLWKSDRIFLPNMDSIVRDKMYLGWQRGIKNLISL